MAVQSVSEGHFPTKSFGPSDSLPDHIFSVRSSEVVTDVSGPHLPRTSTRLRPTPPRPDLHPDGDLRQEEVADEVAPKGRGPRVTLRGLEIGSTCLESERCLLTVVKNGAEESDSEVPFLLHYVSIFLFRPHFQL